MTPEQRREINRIVEDARGRPTGERDAALDRACAGDVELRRAVESLLAEYDRTTCSTERPVAAETASTLGGPTPDTTLQLAFGHYQIERRLGAGGMGEVFLAHDARLGRPVAIKTLLRTGPGDTEQLRRFEQEARAASALNHPNILTVYDIGEHEGMPYIVTEYIEGETLRDRLCRGPMTLNETLGVAMQTAAALVAAHAAGIVHRDIKPENLMLRSDRYLRVLDFGIAKLVSRPLEADRDVADDAASIRTDVGVIIGTAPYMSPEQARGLSVGPATDVWSLGVVMYEMLAGVSPFLGPTISDTLAAILERTPPSLRIVLADIPGELERIVTRALTKSTGDRYTAMQHLLDDLSALKAQTDGVGWSAARVLTIDTSAPPPGPVGPVVPTNLPTAVSSFVGRDRDLTAVGAALTANRLVTLKGGGGIGKTRLALEVASTWMLRYPGGVWLVELAALADSALVAQAVASVLGVRETAAQALIPAICQALGVVGPVLLVLDNCEHVVAACAELVSTLLRRCAHLRVLATSREALAIAGEALYEVEPLSLTAQAAPDSTSSIALSDAMRLFVDRATASRADFRLSEANAPSIARLCERLDGVALAIELAASKVRVLGPEQILERLEDRLGLLVGGDRSALPRQQTLRATLDWSYDLLSGPEQTVLTRVSVFSGGWTLAAAEAVCADELVARGGVFEYIVRLVDKSLVRAETRDGDARYSILETVRAYALAKLDASAAWDMRRRHFAWYRTLATPTATQDSEGAARFQRIAADESNLRAALRWSIDEGGDPVGGLELVSWLAQYWDMRDRMAEGRHWIERAVRAAPDPPGALLGRALRHAGHFARAAGDRASAERAYDESARVLREAGDRRGLLSTLRGASFLAQTQCDFARAERLAQESREIAREIGDGRGYATACLALGLAAMNQEYYDLARGHFEEGILVARRHGNDVDAAVGLHNLGEILLREGRLAESRAALEETLAAAKVFEGGRLVAYTEGLLGQIAAAEGDFESAAALLERTLVYSSTHEDTHGVASALEAISAVLSARGRADIAIQLAGAAERIRAAIGSPRTRYDTSVLERALAASRATLGAEASQCEHVAGQAMDAERATTLACATLRAERGSSNTHVDAL